MPNFLKKILFNEYTIFLAGFIVALILIYNYALNPVPAEVGQVIGAQTFLNSKGELVVKYAFVGSNMDIAVSDNVQQTAKEQKLELVAEDLSARTSSSRTFVTNNPEVRISEFISGPQYFKDDLGYWWQAEYAVATPELFAKLPKTQLYARLTDTSKFAFVKRAFADTSTFYPDPDAETNTVDGYTVRGGTLTWSDIHDGVGTGSGDVDATAAIAQLSASATADRWAFMRRGVFGFYTESIPDGDTISSATFSLRGFSISDQFSQSVVIDRNPPATATALANGDYDLAGWNGVEQATGRITIASWSTAGYNNFTLNAAGISNINKTGASWFGTRLSGDFDNSEPVYSASLIARVNIYLADNTGTTNDPKLVVIHTTPPPSSGSIFNQEVIFNEEVIFQ